MEFSMKSLLSRIAFLMGAMLPIALYYILVESNYRSNVDRIAEKQKEVSKFLAEVRNGSTNGAATLAFKQNYEQLTNQRFPAIYPGWIPNGGSLPSPESLAKNIEMRLVRIEVELGSLTKSFDEYKAAQPPVWLNSLVFPIVILL